MWDDVDTSGECWVYTKGGRVKGGYRQSCDMGRMRLAHRVVYETIHGDLPRKIEVRHLCNTPDCVRPSHLESGTRQENELDKPPELRQRVCAEMRARKAAKRDRTRPR